MIFVGQIWFKIDDKMMVAELGFPVEVLQPLFGSGVSNAFQQQQAAASSRRRKKYFWGYCGSKLASK